MTDSPSDSQPDMTDTLSVTEAAARLGVSERTEWRRIKQGKLTTQRAIDGVRVVLSVTPAEVSDTAPVNVSHVTDTATDTASVPPAGEMTRVFDLIEQIHEDYQRELDQVREDRQQTIDQLRQENDRLFEAARVWQARAMQLEGEIRLLMAPKDEPTDVTPQAPTPADSGPDWQAIAQTLEERVRRLEEPPTAQEPRRSWWRRLWSG